MTGQTSFEDDFDFIIFGSDLFRHKLRNKLVCSLSTFLSFVLSTFLDKLCFCPTSFNNISDLVNGSQTIRLRMNDFLYLLLIASGFCLLVLLVFFGGMPFAIWCEKKNVSSELIGNNFT